MNLGFSLYLECKNTVKITENLSFEIMRCFSPVPTIQLGPLAKQNKLKHRIRVHFLFKLPNNIFT
jgi:hypothetical protein